MYLQMDKDLRDQMQSEGVTWFDYIMKEYVQNQFNEMVAVASIARANGIELSDADKKKISDYMKSFLDYVVGNGYKTVEEYLNAEYAEGITEAAVIRCLETQLLASNHYNEILNSFTYTDEQLRSYADANKKDFYEVDYLYYTFKADTAKDATDEEKAAALTEAKNKADSLLGEIVVKIVGFQIRFGTFIQYHSLFVHTFPFCGQKPENFHKM
jgi:hypothetical protein